MDCTSNQTKSKRSFTTPPTVIKLVSSISVLRQIMVRSEPFLDITMVCLTIKLSLEGDIYEWKIPGAVDFPLPEGPSPQMIALGDGASLPPWKPENRQRYVKHSSAFILPLSHPFSLEHGTTKFKASPSKPCSPNQSSLFTADRAFNAHHCSRLDMPDSYPIILGSRLLF